MGGQEIAPSCYVGLLIEIAYLHDAAISSKTSIFAVVRPQRSSKPKLMPEFSPLTDEGLLPYSNGPIALQYDYRVTILNSVSLSEK